MLIPAQTIGRCGGGRCDEYTRLLEQAGRPKCFKGVHHRKPSVSAVPPRELATTNPTDLAMSDVVSRHVQYVD